MSRIFIRNIPIRTKEQELKNMFSKHGSIIDIVLKPNFAFIQFESDNTANKYMNEYNETIMDGNKITVEIAKTRVEKMAERMGEKCFKCSEYGHWAKNCKAQKREKRGKKRKFHMKIRDIFYCYYYN